MLFPWKRDPALLPDNKQKLAITRLKALEIRLTTKPEQAAAYDEQMKQMVETNLSKKLSNEELKSYKGPVHYIAHHMILRQDSP